MQKLKNSIRKGVIVFFISLVTIHIAGIFQLISDPSAVKAAPDGFTTDHTDVDINDNIIPQDALDQVRLLDVYFIHMSVGSNIRQGLLDLASINPTRYGNNIQWNPQPTWYDTNNGFGDQSFGFNGNPQGKSDAFYDRIVNQNYGGHVDVAFFKYCYGEPLTPPTPLEAWDPYRNTMENLTSDPNYSDVVFVWWTSPIMNQVRVNENQTLMEYNTAVRNYAASHPEVILFDIADIEAHTVSGSECLDANNNQYICSEYSVDMSGHLNAAGRQRVARAWWWLLARITGWNPEGTDTYTLDVNKTGNGSGTITSSPAGIDCGSDCSETFDEGSTATLSASASSGSTFTGWSGSGCSGTGDCTITLNSDSSVTADFAQNTYSISASAGANGSISPSGNITVNYGNDQSFTITPNANYHIEDVLVDGTSVGAVSSYTFQNVVSDHSISATFAQDTVEYTLSVSHTGNGSGTISSSPAGIDCGSDCTESYPASTVVALDAVANIGSTFTGWSGAGCSGVGSCIVQLNSNTIVTANFELNTYEISASAGPNGSTNPSGTITFNQGDTQTFAITPNPGYIISEVLVDNLSVGAVSNYTFGNISSNHTISATFEEEIIVQTYTLSVDKAGSGSGTITSSPQGINCGNDCSESYNEGTLVTLTASPNLGSTFTGWSQASCNGSNNCIVNLDSDVSVTASFNVYQPEPEPEPDPGTEPNTDDGDDETDGTPSSSAQDSSQEEDIEGSYTDEIEDSTEDTDLDIDEDLGETLAESDTADSDEKDDSTPDKGQSLNICVPSIIALLILVLLISASKLIAKSRSKVR